MTPSPEARAAAINYAGQTFSDTAEAIEALACMFDVFARGRVQAAENKLHSEHREEILREVIKK